VIAVMIVNDHPIMRVGLRLAVQRESDMEVVCEVGDAAAAAREFARYRPDVVLIDLQLPHGSGLRVIEAIHALAPTSPIVALTTFPGEIKAPQADTPGPILCVSKAARSEEIMAAIREVERTFGHNSRH
jgi:DNA-binding NarL/FixJ family response regulator